MGGVFISQKKNNVVDIRTVRRKKEYINNRIERASSQRSTSANNRRRSQPPKKGRKKKRSKGLFDNLASLLGSNIYAIRRILAIIVLLAVVSGIVWGVHTYLTIKNGYDVKLDGSSVGVIKKSDAPKSGDDLKNMVIAALQSELKTDIKCDQKVELVPVHISNKKYITVDAATTALKRAMDYNIKATEVFVDNIPKFRLANEQEYEELKQEIIEQYTSPDKTYAEKGFVESVVSKEEFFKANTIISKDEAKAILTAESEVETLYTVVSGDNLGKIALKFKTTSAKICEANPGVTPTTILRINDQLKIVSKKPFVSVRTAEVSSVKSVIKFTTVYKDVQDKKKTYQNILQTGINGEMEIATKTIYINGIQSEVMPGEQIITVKAQEQIIERGVLD